MTLSTTDLYNILSAKLGKEEAKTLVTFIEDEVKKKKVQKESIISAKLWVAFIILVALILGLYPLILLKN